MESYGLRQADTCARRSVSTDSVNKAKRVLFLLNVIRNRNSHLLCCPINCSFSRPRISDVCSSRQTNAERLAQLSQPCYGRTSSMDQVAACCSRSFARAWGFHRSRKFGVLYVLNLLHFWRTLAKLSTFAKIAEHVATFGPVSV